AGAGDYALAALDRTVGYQQRGDRALVLIQSRFDDRTHAQAVRVGLQLENFGLQEDHLQQVDDALARLGGYRHENNVAAPVLYEDAVFRQILLDAVGIGARLIYLVDGLDDRHSGRLGVADGFYRLRLDGIVGRYHQHGDVGD